MELIKIVRMGMQIESTGVFSFVIVRSFALLCGISPHFVSTRDVVGFICIREPSVCHMVSIRKREDPGKENEITRMR